MKAYAVGGSWDDSLAWSVSSGMSLRDYFAAKALAGWGEAFHAIAWQRNERSPDADAIAATCYVLADAMLKAREAEQ